MKVLQINSVFRSGSTGKIVQCIHEELKENGFDSCVIYGRKKRINEKGVFKTCFELEAKVHKLISFVTGGQYFGLFFPTMRMIKRIKKEKPDVVHLHCLNGDYVNIYKLIKWLNKEKIKTVLSLHAEFMYTANCGHAFECEKWKTGCGKCPSLMAQTRSLFIDRTAQSWKLMKDSFRGFDSNLLVASVSNWLMERAKQSPILSDKKHVVVNNGLDESVFYYQDTVEKRKNMGLNNKKIIFHVTPSFSDEPTSVKGGRDLIEIAKLLETDKDIVILVAGPNACKRQLPNNIITLGKITDQHELAQLYSMADVTMIVSKRETFSMVTIESLSCGTPVVGYKAGGPESIALKDYSSFVENGDIAEIIKSCHILLQKEFDKEKISAEALEKYSKESMARNYIELYKELLKENC